VLVIIGIVLLWFGYNLFFGRMSPFYPGFFLEKKEKPDSEKGAPGEPQVCLVCSTKLVRGQLVKTIAFPTEAAGISRLMYIRGCTNCLNNIIDRICPICGLDLKLDDYLIARMFERRHRNNHVHVLGCNYCKKSGKLPD
jgi:hypothetical protein